MLAPNVKIIQPTKPRETSLDILKAALPKRVCAYCRVSTDSEDQKTSYESQKIHYEKKIREHEGWIFAGIYADEGISGTSMKKRKEFNKMIAEAMAGNIDIILTKSVSRFARNVVDILTIVEQLTLKGVPIIFETERINSMEDQAGTRMQLLMSAAIAEDFSQNLSLSVKWGKRRRIEQGNIPCTKTYGYRIKNGNYEVYEPEAEIVRFIFKSFLAGQTYRQIAHALENRQNLSPGGKTNWKSSTVQYIIENEKYKGDLLLQKQTYSDIKFRKRIKNTEEKQYYIEDHHPPIVSKTDWNRAQKEREMRTSQRGYSPTGKGCYSSKYAFSNKLYCLSCGSKLRRHCYYTADKKVYTWVCINRKAYKNCKQDFIKETDLEKTFVELMNEIMVDKQGFIETVINNIETVVRKRNEAESTEEIDSKILAIQNEMIGLVKAMTIDNTTDITTKTQSMLKEIERLKEAKATIIAEGLNLQRDLCRMDDLRQILNEKTIFQTFNEDIFRRTVDKVLLDGKMATFVFCDAVRLTKRIVEE